MATPKYSDVIDQLNTFIITNGNNEITASVLNPVLKFMTDFANNNMGDLSLLTTDLTNDLVSAINSLKQNFEDLSNNGVQLYTGVPNPNITPPATYNYADFYMQIDSIDSSPVQLWQWDGFNWVQSSQFEVLANKRGSFTTDGTGQLYYNVDYINSALDLKLNKGAYPGTASDLVLGKQIADAAEKTTIVDNDRIGIADSEDSNNSKYWKFSTVKSVLKTYFDSFYITLTGSHTISGLKTFLHGSLGLRNGTNTVTSYFSNDNTSTRTYTLQNRSGTLLDNTDLAAINASISGRQVKDDQIEVPTNRDIQNSWHGQTILFTSTCTITVPATLNNSLMFAFRTLAGVTVTWAITSPFTWETTPLATPEKTVGHFMRRGSTNVIFLDV